MKQFRSALQARRFSLTAEMPPPAAGSLDAWLAQARTMAERVDGIVIGESPPGSACLSPLALASLLLQEDIDPVPRVHCRDRNRIALQSDLLGLRAMGVTSVLLEQGDMDRFEGKAVFDVSRDELIATAVAMNEELRGSADMDLLVGVSTDLATGDSLSLQAAAAAGARFLVTTPILNLASLAAAMKQLVEDRITWSFSLIATLTDADLFSDSIEELQHIPGVSGANLRLNPNE